MKRYFFTICLLLGLNTVALWSQEWHFGARGGLTVGALLGNVDFENSSGSPMLGGHAGLYGTYNLNEKWAIETHVLYNKTGVKYAQNIPRTDTLYALEVAEQIFYTPTLYTVDVAGEYHLHYLDLPLQISYQLVPKFAVHFGTHFSFLLNGKNTGSSLLDLGGAAGQETEYETEEQYVAALYSRTYEEFDESNSLNRFDIGLQLGTSWQIYRALAFRFDVNNGFLSVQGDSDTITDKFYNVYMRFGLAFEL